MIFLFILIFGVLFLFFNIRQIAPGNKGSIVAGAIVVVLPVCFFFRGHFLACLGQDFLSVWLCEALLIYLLWWITRGVLLAVRRRRLERERSIFAARILLVATFVVSIVLCAVGYGVHGDYKIREASIDLPKVVAVSAQAPSPFTILFFSDLHIDPLFDRAKLERMIHDADSLRPDYIVFGGDFADIHDSLLYRDGYDTLVAKFGATARVAALAVNGNHEGYMERQGSAPGEFLKRTGWKFLDDETFCDSLACFTGRTDFQVSRSREVPRKALSELAPKPAPFPATSLSDSAASLADSAQSVVENFRPWIVVDHQPKGIEPEHTGRLPDLALSGHTHDGQFFPGTVIIDWVWRLAYGVGELDGVKWLVSSGVGSWGPPVRVGSETEMWLLRLR
ncbi:metallophosphoesterase [Fibrobacter sp.]|uniref:metallophosphoesterase n=1 Tax=Fibrobacter sp. TaxID=35828 RepID=UPI00388CFD78